MFHQASHTFFEPNFGGGSGYRFGFNGKEMDNETYGAGNEYDYGFRVYNPRLGKFLSVDPLTKSYPWYTPYQFAGNKPIWAIDLDGLEELLYSTKARRENKGFDLALNKMTNSGITKELKQRFSTGNNNVDIHIYVADINDPIGSDVGARTFPAVIDANTDMKDVEKRIDAKDLNLSKVAESIKNGKGVILIVLDKENVEKDKTGNSTALTTTHEIDAHGMDMKDGKNDVPGDVEHGGFYNDPSLIGNGGYSPAEKDIKKDSPTGKYKDRIEKASSDKKDKKQ